jgi:arylsulfatase
MQQAIFSVLSGISGTILACAAGLADTIGDPEPPNVIIILADDAGYADLGRYSRIVDTPNLDALAAGGSVFRRFYSNARCSPTRASLLTGRYPAAAGFAAGTLGHWPDDLGLPGYRARLPYQLPTLAELLKNEGYRTFLSGKWHLGGSNLRQHPALKTLWHKDHPGSLLSDDEIEAEFLGMPLQRGFDQFFGLLGGESHHFLLPETDNPYLSGNTPAKLQFDKEYSIVAYFESRDRYPYLESHGSKTKAVYSTDLITDRALDMLSQAHASEERPYFLLLSYQAPHHPLQAPAGLVEKYAERYHSLSALERSALGRLRTADLFPLRAAYRSSFDGEKPRFTHAEPSDAKLRLAIHAAMMERLDYNVGRVVAYLSETRQLESTLVLYLSDNGAATNVADIANKPYFGAKGLLWEGGIRTQCIAHWPGTIEPGLFIDTVGWVGDLLPTVLEAAGTRYPQRFRGAQLAPLDGRSLLPALLGESMPPPMQLFFNDKGQQAIIYRGRWKLLIEPGWYVHTSQRAEVSYELYDLEADPAEVDNLAAVKPALAAQLAVKARDWQRQHGIMDYAEIKSRYE